MCLLATRKVPHKEALIERTAVAGIGRWQQIYCYYLLVMRSCLRSTGEIDKGTAVPRPFAFGPVVWFLAMSHGYPNVFCCESLE